MSDSDDFGGLAPTTPHPPVKRKANSKPHTIRGAGPSNSNKPPSNATAGSNASRKKARTGTNQIHQDEDAGEASDVREILVNEVDEDAEEEDVQDLGPQKPPQRGGSRKPLSKDSVAPARTAASNSKGKGKQKAGVAVSNGKGSGAVGRKEVPSTVEELEDQEDMEEDENVEDVMEVDDPTANARTSTKNGNKKNTASTNSHSSRPNPPPPKSNPGKSRNEEKLSAENARLKEEVERLKGHIEDLKGKFEELMNTRQTEPENLMEEMAKNHERQYSLQNELIKDLTSQLAKKEPLLRPGKKWSIGLVSRDDMDQEIGEYKAQIQHFKNELNNAMQVVKEKDSQIEELKQVEKELRFELKTEIQRSEQLVKQTRVPPPSATRGGGILKGEDPKHTKVVALYEDLTNILVHTVKFNPGQYEGEEWVFTCIYTWRDDLDVNVPEKSLNFALRMCKEPSGEDGGALIENVHYYPMNLDNEKPEFVENLGFLNKAFSFPKTQLSLFVRTLYDNLNNATEDDD